MDLKALQREAHAIAKEKGWWDEERTFLDIYPECRRRYGGKAL